jgi:biotin carboxyl carrier protein
MSTEVLTSVPGNIWKVLVNVGDEVKEGDVLFIMEVMKSEVNHNAPINGTATEVNMQNDQEGVSPGTIAIVID